MKLLNDQEESENTVGFDHVGVAVPASTARQRYAMHGMKKSSKYQNRYWGRKYYAYCHTASDAIFLVRHF